MADAPSCGAGSGGPASGGAAPKPGAKPRKVYCLANPRGFCAGVDRAINIVEKALGKFGAPIYVRHEVVHNRYVVSRLKAKGVIFVEELDEVPPGAVLIYSAHGVAKSIREEAARRGFRVFDATCPLVTKVHREVERLDGQGRQIVMIGHKGHPEVEGTMGQIEGEMLLVESVADVAKLSVRDPGRLAHVSQTTLSVDETQAIVAALKARFPEIKSPSKDDICYATQNRQDAVKRLCERCDGVVVVGSPNSSNSNRLREVARLRGVDACLVDDAQGLQASWFEGKSRVGVTAGASAPEILVDGGLRRLREWGFEPENEGQGAQGGEDIAFVLPVELRD